jgi:UDP-glucose 4-epimerase
MTTVVITGATGYLGSVLVDHLARQNPITHVISAVRDIDSPKARKISSNAKVTLVDIHRFFDVDNGKIDFICHLAACRDTLDPVGLTDSVLLTERLLEYAVEVDAKGFLFCSSQAIYGKGKPFYKETAPPSPVTLYGMSKFASERLLIAASNRHPTLQTVSLRLGTLIGPSKFFTTHQRALPHLLIEMAARQKNAILPFGGSQLFDFIDVRDAAKIINRLLALSTEKWPHTLNVGSGIQVSALTTAKIVAAASHQHFSRTLQIEMPGSDKTPRHFGMAIDKLRATLPNLDLIPLKKTIGDICATRTAMAD